MEKNVQATENKVFADMPQAFADPGHPGFHLTAPAHFTIDFWGPFIHKGYYHIMYHVCPDRGDFQEETIFFHSRSRNLIDWEMLPCPIAPLKSELRLNDGCICLNGDNKPVMLYTSCPKEHVPRTHCAAIGDDDLLSFERSPQNPILTLDTHGGPAFEWGWSDPFVFQASGRTFMLMSKCVADGKAMMPIYEATDATMLHWAYKGIFFDSNGEVVNFFPLDGKWVLIDSPYDTIEYFVGTFNVDTLRFSAEYHDVLSYGYHSQSHPIDRGFYASFVYQQPHRTVLGGWISGFHAHNLWDGCMSIPRELGLNSKLQLTQKVIPEFGTLRGQNIYQTTQPVQNIAFQANTSMLEIELFFVGETMLSINRDTLEIRVYSEGFSVNDEFYARDLNACGHLQVLIDKTVAEIWLGEGVVCATRCFSYIGETPEVKTISEGSIERFICTAINPCRIDKAPF